MPDRNAVAALRAQAQPRVRRPSPRAWCQDPAHLRVVDRAQRGVMGSLINHPRWTARSVTRAAKCPTKPGADGGPQQSPRFTDISGPSRNFAPDLSDPAGSRRRSMPALRVFGRLKTCSWTSRRRLLGSPLLHGRAGRRLRYDHARLLRPLAKDASTCRPRSARTRSSVRSTRARVVRAERDDGRAFASYFSGNIIQICGRCP